MLNKWGTHCSRYKYKHTLDTRGNVSLISFHFVIIHFRYDSINYSEIWREFKINKTNEWTILGNGLCITRTVMCYNVIYPQRSCQSSKVWRNIKLWRFCSDGGPGQEPLILLPSSFVTVMMTAAVAVCGISSRLVRYVWSTPKTD